jgi:hypothetical protein
MGLYPLPSLLGGQRRRGSSSYRSFQRRPGIDDGRWDGDAARQCGAAGEAGGAGLHGRLISMREPRGSKWSGAPTVHLFSYRSDTYSLQLNFV